MEDVQGLAEKNVKALLVKRSMNVDAFKISDC
jgi:hypothetical protein